MNQDTKTIIREIGSHKFPGFYESIFDSSWDFIDEEAELKNKFAFIDKSIDVYFEYEDFDEYKRDVCIAFMKEYVDKICEVLPYEITDDENFIFSLSNEKDIEVISPQYYNFSTDRCYCDIKTNVYTLDKIKNYTLQLDDAQEYIKKHFTSYDGFISFINNDIEYWKNLEVKDYEENMLIALLDMLLTLDDEENIFDISLTVRENICQDWYVYPTVWYKNKTYSQKTVRNEEMNENEIKIIELLSNI